MVVAHLDWKPVHGVSNYQLMVYDRTTASVVFDDTVSGATHAVQIPEERSNHDLSMRVRALCGDSWGEWSEFEPLPLEVVLGERRDAQPDIATGEELGLLLIFTVDTECSLVRQPNPNPDRVVDELIFGDFGNGKRSGGIGLQMDLLEHFGFRGTFFVDILMEFEHGRSALERTIEAIAARGHEIELHVHPEHLRGSSDPHAARLADELSGGRAERDRDVFRRLMELSVDLFERRLGRRPLAYRAGAYRIADIQFPVLDEFGIRVDSSVQPYFNSRVPDWMRTRTQPFRVGRVLEAPPTFLLLNEKPGAWESRGFTPSSNLGDPISTLPAEPGGPPRVATFVSHSFQLLRRYDSQEQAAIEVFAQRLRSAVPADAAERLLRESAHAVRTFGEEVDDGLVASVAGILRRVADRPDARCATYADLVSVADRFWPSEHHPPLDPVPLVDRNRGVTGVSGTRIFNRSLLSHLAVRGAPGLPTTHTGASGRDWIEGLERGGARQLRDRLRQLAGGDEPGSPLPVRFRTLGVLPAERRGALPVLAELLFPLSVLYEAGDGMLAEPSDVLAWDVPTFRSWFEAAGFDVISERRVPRGPEEMATVASFAEKLRWLDPLELRTEAVELKLVPGNDTEPDLQVEHGLLVPETVSGLYESTGPGCELTFSTEDESSLASETTSSLAFMRAGFEVLAREGRDYRLLRPIELGDIRRFAGMN